MKKYFKQLKANKKGFTLIEMIVVIAIIGILAAILVPSMSGYLSNARKSKQEANARTVYTAAQAAVTSLETATTAVDGTYISSSTDAASKALFGKIEELVGTSNYEKFDVIEVEVTNGGVDYVKVTENGAQATDAITYPEQPQSSSNAGGSGSGSGGEGA